MGVFALLATLPEGSTIERNDDGTITARSQVEDRRLCLTISKQVRKVSWLLGGPVLPGHSPWSGNGIDRDPLTAWVTAQRLIFWLNNGRWPNN